MTLLHGFELQEERRIPELNLNASLYRHARTGARLLSISNEDENKVFGITFRTPPPDSTGLPHILEHSVLNGSERFPVREPFIELAKGSLKTFLNAMTGSDLTTYPVASQNLQDFYNLVDVYMDAVLHPLLSEYTLMQEGWHHELDSMDGPLTYKGVVFNEMKGAYSSADGRLATVTQTALFPGHIYALDSGGDPQVIPDLTYQQFKNYHAAYYHPSNSFIYFYGDDDPAERLRRMDAYLQGYEAAPVNSAIGLVTPITQPRQLTFAYDAGEEEQGENKSQAVVSWVLGEAADVELALALDVLEYVLIGTAAAPLRKALVDSGLGEDLAGFGLDTHLRQWAFSTGLKGIRSADTPRVEALVLDTLRQIVSQGIDAGTLAASMNTVEFHLRENNTGSFPRGLALMMRCLSSWIYDRDPLGPLAFEAPLNAIKNRLAAGERYFESLIEHYLVDNPHRITILLEPDANYASQLAAAETARLERERAAMTPSDLEITLDNSLELRRRQDTVDSAEALATIPSLRLADLERANKLIPIETGKLAGVPLYYHDLFTNRIIYMDLGFNLHALPGEFLPLVNLFGRALKEMGAGQQDFVQLSQRIGMHTGGIRVSTFNSAQRGQPAAPSVGWLFLRSKATLDKAPELFSVLQDILTSAWLDNKERFRQLVLEEKADAEARIVPSGNHLVNLRLRARFDEAGWASEQIDGVSYLFALRALVEQIESDWPAVQSRLETMRRLLVNRSAMLCNVTLDAASWANVQPRLGEFFSALPDGSFEPQTWRWLPVEGGEGLAIPAQVNYVGMGANLYALDYELSGSASVICKFLNATWLWEKVRVQGGAYGGSCSFDQRSGVFTFLSYRDPNISQTLGNYAAAADYLAGLDDSRLNPSELEKTIIGAIGDMDAYQLPDAKGFISLVRALAGDTDAIRQRLRDQILSTSRADFHAFGSLLKRFNQQAQIVVLGSQSALEKASAGLSIQKVL